VVFLYDLGVYIKISSGVGSVIDYAQFIIYSFNSFAMEVEQIDSFKGFMSLSVLRKVICTASPC